MLMAAGTGPRPRTHDPAGIRLLIVSAVPLAGGDRNATATSILPHLFIESLPGGPPRVETGRSRSRSFGRNRHEASTLQCGPTRGQSSAGPGVWQSPAR